MARPRADANETKISQNTVNPGFAAGLASISHVPAGSLGNFQRLSATWLVTVCAAKNSDNGDKLSSGKHSVTLVMNRTEQGE
jgi:hypothetical protein